MEVDLFLPHFYSSLSLFGSSARFLFVVSAVMSTVALRASLIIVDVRQNTAKQYGAAVRDDRVGAVCQTEN